ncbi:DUF2911 domain-containing protein [Pontibacter sp. JH31]|uniref:DUF2911 domain-containing protein n=1 Tax=Pontibacter aquaedesilientis TaxID=2766980 RepID=A0ABR7XDU4_9BACT|nr:DUF2911 domain-containing protein [Pontibacter aquaedesilientis]MBD1396467.1 DUF2911 domain-containing protein [Pontibacter aquaedesilientis]
MNHNITKLASVLFLCATLTYCNQPEQEQEQETPVAQDAHEGHSMKTSEGATIIGAQAEADTLKGSLKAEAHGMIGDAHLTIAYHSPAVRGRMIWGGLVAYNQVWVTGAHSATSLTTDKDITVGGKELPAGKYALFTIPGEKEWTIILNKNWEQHLADDYAEADDVLRFTVQPEIAPVKQERLRYEIVSGDGATGNIQITWDMLKVSLPVAQ